MSLTYRPDVQGLRAIAVLAVIAFHFNSVWLPGGFVGVDIFFVLSGFLITSILVDKKQNENYSFSSTLQYFYLSRIRRIIPAYFFMLVMVGIFTAILFLRSDFTDFLEGFKNALWFNSNNYYANFGSYFAPATYEQTLLHTWSLAVEIQFYLIAPLLITLFPIRLLEYTLWAGIIIFTGIAEYYLRFIGTEQATYYSLAARLPEFFSGSLAAIYLVNKSYNSTIKTRCNIYGLLLLIMAFVLQPTLGPFPGVLTLLPILGTVLILLSAPRSRINNYLSHPWLVWIGSISYSLYLWHWPILALMRYCSGSNVLNLTYSFIFVISTLSVSLFSYYLVESPFRTSINVKRTSFAWGILAGGMGLTMFNIDHINSFFTPPKLSVAFQRYADPAKICHGQIVGECLRGDLTSKRELLVLGDSHAAMLNHFFDLLGKELGFKARIITGSSCVTIPGFDYQRLPHWAQQACINQIDVAKKLYDTSQLIILAGAWNYQFTSIDFPRILTTFLDDAQKTHKKIIILTQVPLLNASPLRNERFQYIGVPTQGGINQDYLRTNGILRNISNNYSNVNLIDLSAVPFFIKAPIFNGELMYFDNSHLNEIGAEIYAESAKSAFSRIINND